MADVYTPEQLSVLNLIPDIVTIVDPQKNYTWLNQTATDFFGPDAIGKPASHYFSSPQKTYNIVEPLFSGSQDPVYLESWQTRKDGQNRLLAWWCHAIKNDSGKVIGSISTARDVTDQKNLEQELQKNDDRLTKAQEAASVGNWELDLATKSITASKQAYKIYGLDENSTQISLEQAQKLVLPAYRPFLDQALKKLIDGDMPYDVQFEIKNNHDQIRHIHSIAKLQKDELGRPVKVTGTIHDNTDLTLINQSLAQSQILLQNIIDLLPVRIFWKDSNLNYLGCNQAFASDAGMASPKDLIGKDDLSMNWKDQAEFYRADDRKVIDSGISKLDYEEPQTTPSGGNIWVNTNKVPLLDNSGKIIGILGTYSDITQKKSSELELKRKNKELEIINTSTIERETKMIELKKRIKDLETKLAAYEPPT